MLRAGIVDLRLLFLLFVVLLVLEFIDIHRCLALDFFEGFSCSLYSCEVNEAPSNWLVGSVAFDESVGDFAEFAEDITKILFIEVLVREVANVEGLAIHLFDRFRFAFLDVFFVEESSQHIVFVAELFILFFKF